MGMHGLVRVLHIYSFTCMYNTADNKRMLVWNGAARCSHIGEHFCVPVYVCKCVCVCGNNFFCLCKLSLSICHFQHVSTRLYVRVCQHSFLCIWIRICMCAYFYRFFMRVWSAYMRLSAYYCVCVRVSCGMMNTIAFSWCKSFWGLIFFLPISCAHMGDFVGAILLICTFIVTHLWVYSLRNNQFGDAGLIALSESLSGNQSLTGL